MLKNCHCMFYPNEILDILLRFIILKRKVLQIQNYGWRINYILFNLLDLTKAHIFIQEWGQTKIFLNKPHLHKLFIHYSEFQFIRLFIHSHHQFIHHQRNHLANLLLFVESLLLHQ